MIKLFHFYKTAAYAVTALRAEQITAVRLCCAHTLISNGQQSIKRNILAKRKANDSAVLDLMQ